EVMVQGVERLAVFTEPGLDDRVVVPCGRVLRTLLGELLERRGDGSQSRAVDLRQGPVPRLLPLGRHALRPAAQLVKAAGARWQTGFRAEGALHHLAPFRGPPRPSWGNAQCSVGGDGTVTVQLRLGNKRENRGKMVVGAGVVCLGGLAGEDQRALHLSLVEPELRPHPQAPGIVRAEVERLLKNLLALIG